MMTQTWLGKIQACCLSISICLSAGISQSEDPPVFSGPQPGEKLAAFKVRGVLGELAG